MTTNECNCVAVNHTLDHAISCPASLYQAGIQRGRAEAAAELDAKHAKLVLVADKLQAERRLTDALMALLPRCDRHPERPATKAWHRDCARWCDECGDADRASDGVECPEYPRAPAIRAIQKDRAERASRGDG